MKSSVFTVIWRNSSLHKLLNVCIFLSYMIFSTPTSKCLLRLTYWPMCSIIFSDNICFPMCFTSLFTLFNVNNYHWKGILIFNIYNTVIIRDQAKEEKTQYIIKKMIFDIYICMGGACEYIYSHKISSFLLIILKLFSYPKKESTV